ncbi:MAG: hypothetical protein J1E99_08135, partial [Muribaculaceae bacterium]|nr:hypothetical protein [Muribaculaceae bacterium]
PDDVTPSIPSEEVTPLSRANLRSFDGDQSRVDYSVISRSDNELGAGELRLIASIQNPSKDGKISQFVKQGRYLSASSVFYNESDGKYYVTYHMQGNNYNTSENDETSGFIEVFDLKGEDESMEVDLDNIYMSANPSELDFDFNHLYFDNISNRIVAVGHKSEPVKNGNGNKTAAIISKLNFKENTIDYSTIYTGNKILDGVTNQSLGKEDARDGNGVVRVVDYPHYYVATRKGIAVLYANDENLFEPVLNNDETIYFVPTPGSTKFVYNTPRVGSMMNFLYLSEDNKAESYTSSSKANVAQFQVATTGKDTFLGLINPVSPWTTYYDSKDLNILEYPKQFELPEVITPIDGKNAFCVIEDYEYYVPLGTNGIYYKFKGCNTSRDYEGVMKFDNRPVNFVYTDKPEFENGHDGFVYVANGAKLTILHRRTMEVVATYNVPSVDADGNDVASSANYIHVRKAPRVGESFEPRERIITVAFGQAGVKIFRFKPEKKTVWEKEIQ